MTDSQSLASIRYCYTFHFADGTEKQFEVTLRADTLELLSSPHQDRPGWTKLNYFQCEQCPLGETVEYCPLAVNLSSLVESFKGSVSYESTRVTVQSDQRTYIKDVPLQKALSSIIGIYMVTSNCPVMDPLRPNVRFHLPFATAEETIYRAVSMYLTQQYFIMRVGGTPDWELKHLAEVYKGVWLVNKGVTQRLSHASQEDANVNAVIVLSTHGENLDDFLEESLQEIEGLVRPSMKPENRK